MKGKKFFKDYIGTVTLKNDRYLFESNNKYLWTLRKNKELEESISQKRELSQMKQTLDQSIIKHQADPRQHF